MLKDIIKKTLETFMILLDEDMSFSNALYNLIILSLSSDEVNTLIIGYDKKVEFLDDLKIISINDKEISILSEQYSDKQGLEFIQSTFYHIVVDYIGNMLRVKSVEVLDSDDAYEFMDDRDFNKIFKNEHI